jgi:hypothetical protein
LGSHSRIERVHYDVSPIQEALTVPELFTTLTAHLTVTSMRAVITHPTGIPSFILCDFETSYDFTA